MPRIRYNVYIESEQRDALRRIKARDGIPESEQIRRAIDWWLSEKGEATKKTAKKTKK